MQIVVKGAVVLTGGVALRAQPPATEEVFQLEDGDQLATEDGEPIAAEDQI